MLYFVFFVTIVVVSVVVAILNKNNAAYNSLQTAHLCGLCWSCLTDLNRRPLPYQIEFNILKYVITYVEIAISHAVHFQLATILATLFIFCL